jgi:hypothetical protein
VSVTNARLKKGPERQQNSINNTELQQAFWMRQLFGSHGIGASRWSLLSQFLSFTLLLYYSWLSSLEGASLWVTPTGPGVLCVISEQSEEYIPFQFPYVTRFCYQILSFQDAGKFT